MDETGKIVVYRFMVFDAELGRYVISGRMATLDRIKADSNYVVRGSAKSVDRCEVGADGMTLPD
jgi:hypothetical protein